ncbi:uncharacterized protein LOC115324686 isoform X1 [Ixodes scapularis]|uniref:uncharacterized protein LOC115324686 isoform X1 n=1 Tax=Ixodes scapularis TaxID=6945 RepID=UPI001A9DBC79|nr:uncharacterized protein LOC115324686 isoform X1 [Ixodes scapularis]
MLRGTDGFFLRKMQDGEPEKAAKQIVGNLSPTPQPFRFSHLNKLLRSCIADRCVVDDVIVQRHIGAGLKFRWSEQRREDVRKNCLTSSPLRQPLTHACTRNNGRAA